MNRLAIALLLSFASAALAETDYVARDLIKKMDKRLAAVEQGPTLRVQSSPGGSFTTIPGYTSLELLAAGSISMTPTAPSSGVARVVVSSSGGIYDSSSPGSTNLWARSNGAWVAFSPSSGSGAS